MIHKLRGLFAAVFAALLAVTLVPSAALALDANGGSLTVSNLKAGDTVQLYKVASITVKADNTLSKAWTNINTDKSVADYEGMSTDDKAAFANTVASTVTGSPVDTITATGTSVTFSNLDAGLYYARVSNAKDATVVYKNTLIPVNLKAQSDGTWGYDTAQTVDLKKSNVSIVKTVSSDGQSYAETTDGVSTNGTVYYKVVVTVPQYNGATGRTFSLSDTLPAGITLESSSVKVDGTAVTPTVTDQTFTVDLSDQLATKGGQTVTVTYAAKLTGTGLVANGRVNTATLTFSANSYGDDTKTTSDTATVNNGGIKIIKVSSKDENTKLQGATFKITVNGHDYEATTDDNGEATFNVALAAGTYKVTETVAPAGYSKVDDQKITVTADNTIASNTTTIADPVDTAAGALPSTGGTGTIALTVVGVVVLAGAATVLVRNRKQD
jgi:fimbrial isopeptide formation D2 family protein/LPXTG-motif cell wall-anchored protein